MDDETFKKTNDYTEGTPLLHEPSSAKSFDRSLNSAETTAHSIADRTLNFLSTASKGTISACLVGLSIATYLLLGRVGLVLIGVVGGVVLHATWESGAGNNADDQRLEERVKRRNEIGVEVLHRVLTWRFCQRENDNDGSKGDAGGIGVSLYSGKQLDYSGFGEKTGTAMTNLTNAIVRDYVQ